MDPVHAPSVTITSINFAPYFFKIPIYVIITLYHIVFELTKDSGLFIIL